MSGIQEGGKLADGRQYSLSSLDGWIVTDCQSNSATSQFAYLETWESACRSFFASCHELGLGLDLIVGLATNQFNYRV